VLMHCMEKSHVCSVTFLQVSQSNKVPLIVWYCTSIYLRTNVAWVVPVLKYNRIHDVLMRCTEKS
jgi:hypothetical protein